MEVTVDDKLNAAQRHLEHVVDACKGLDARSNRVRELAYAAAYILDAVKQIKGAIAADYEDVR